MSLNACRTIGNLATVGLLAYAIVGINAEQRATPTIAIDADDIAGMVSSEEGPEAGVWVVAETSDLPTRFVRIVVTDDEGRYLLPDLPKATYQIFVRGYGLFDSPRVVGRPGQRLNVTVATTPSERDAAVVYPAAYWLTVMRVPPTGPVHPADLTRTMKTCMGCHQLGNKATRELPQTVRGALSHLEAWDARMKNGPAGAVMSEQFARLRGQRTMLSEWTERIAAGAYPLEAPPRPKGLERNVVITLWDWGKPMTLAYGETVSDRRNYRVNANGRIYGSSRFDDELLWMDPSAHTAGAVKIPTSVLPSRGTPSASFDDEPIWAAAAEPGGTAIDQSGRVWIAARHRPVEKQPAFCADGVTNQFARHYPLERGNKQVSVYDPKTRQFTQIDTCFDVEQGDLGADDRIYFGGGNSVGWVNTRGVDTSTRSEPVRSESLQGWCPIVLDTNGDGTITRGWTEPNQPVDRARDHRIDFTCHQPSVALDGSVWCSSGSESDDRIVRLEIGLNPPESCKAEVYEVPRWRDIGGARGLDVDDRGVAWINMAATDHVASFDRGKCKTLNGSAATGQHCPEGWRFYPVPGLPYSIAAPTAGGDVALRGGRTARTTDLLYGMTVDRIDVLGLNRGQAVPMTELSNSDALLALSPETGEFTTLRVPYPLGFFARSVHGRIDDAAAGWKGRALWSSYASGAGWHVEGGPGVRSKVVKFQVRPDPLAK